MREVQRLSQDMINALTHERFLLTSVTEGNNYANVLAGS